MSHPAQHPKCSRKPTGSLSLQSRGRSRGEGGTGSLDIPTTVGPRPSFKAVELTYLIRSRVGSGQAHPTATSTWVHIQAVHVMEVLPDRLEVALQCRGHTAPLTGLGHASTRDVVEAWCGPGDVGSPCVWTVLSFRSVCLKGSCGHRETSPVLPMKPAPRWGGGKFWDVTASWQQLSMRCREGACPAREPAPAPPQASGPRPGPRGHHVPPAPLWNRGDWRPRLIPGGSKGPVRPV